MDFGYTVLGLVLKTKLLILTKPRSKLFFLENINFFKFFSRAPKFECPPLVKTFFNL